MQHGRGSQHGQRNNRGGNLGGNRGGNRDHNGHRFNRDFERGHFGREHSFRIREEVVYEGHRGFWSGGYFFWYAAWPLGWGYYDNVWVEYDADIDGYVLYNVGYPGVALNLSVEF